MVWHVPLQVSPVQHSLVDPQLVPEPLHEPAVPQTPAGAPVQTPLQHWVALVQSVPLLKQSCSQTPLGQEPEQH
jgi:hypothetical protein